MSVIPDRTPGSFEDQVTRAERDHEVVRRYGAGVPQPPVIIPDRPRDHVPDRLG